MEDTSSSEKFQIPSQIVNYHNTVQTQRSNLRFTFRKIIEKMAILSSCFKRKYTQNTGVLISP